MIVLGQRVTSHRSLGGGDLSRVSRLRLEDGREVVLKQADCAGREAAMLSAIADAGVPCPVVLDSGADVLCLSLIPHDSRPSTTGWREAGMAVSRLHSAVGERYGWTEDHAFGPAPIPYEWSEDWPPFWAERRLLAWPDAVPPEISARLETLAADLPNRLPARPSPALLHGDLWSGNLLLNDGRFAALIDPACYYGHGEVDLAMLDLFGGLNDAFLEGYRDIPHPERKPIYQLWPALVHLRLFGDGYRGMVERLLTQTGV